MSAFFVRIRQILWETLSTTERNSPILVTLFSVKYFTSFFKIKRYFGVFEQILVFKKIQLIVNFFNVNSALSKKRKKRFTFPFLRLSKFDFQFYISLLHCADWLKLSQPHQFQDQDDLTLLFYFI